MYSVEIYQRIRRACHVDGMSIRKASEQFWNTPQDREEDSQFFHPAGVSAITAYQISQT